MPNNLITVKITPIRSNVYKVEGIENEFYDINLFSDGMIGKKFYALIRPRSPLDVIYRLVKCEQDN